MASVTLMVMKWASPMRQPLQPVYRDVAGGA